MDRKALPVLIPLFALLLASCAPQSSAPEGHAATRAPAAAGRVDLNVFAAASLTAPFEEISEKFEAAHPEASVRFNFAGSQQLAQQIIEGAPADVFASANHAQMEAVIDAGGILTGTQQTFARNRLVVIVPQDHPAGIKALKDLAKPGLKTVLAAETVPVGQYSLDFLDKANGDPEFGPAFKDDVLENVVSYEDNVKAVLTKVALGEADAGIVYMSDVTGEYAGQVNPIDIPDALNVFASYPIAPIQDNEQAELAQKFIDLVLSAEGQSILAKHGLIPAGEPAVGGPAPGG